MYHLYRINTRNLKITLETRRLGEDQFEVFKILNGYENIDRNIFSWSRKREGLEDMESL